MRVMSAAPNMVHEAIRAGIRAFCSNSTSSNLNQLGWSMLTQHRQLFQEPVRTAQVVNRQTSIVFIDFDEMAAAPHRGTAQGIAERIFASFPVVSV